METKVKVKFPNCNMNSHWETFGMDLTVKGPIDLLVCWFVTTKISSWDCKFNEAIQERYFFCYRNIAYLKNNRLLLR